MRNLVPEFIFEHYLNNNNNSSFNATVLSVDISGFTKTTELLMKQGNTGAEKLSDLLEFYFDETVKAIHAYKGFIASFGGDGFYAVFPEKDLSMKALRAAEDINQFFLNNRLYNVDGKQLEFTVKTGLATGEIDVNIIEDEHNCLYYFSGIALENAKAAEEHCQGGQICFHESLITNNSLYADLKRKNISKEMYQLTAPTTIDIARETYLFQQYDTELIKKFAGKKETDFTNSGEFREVTSLFISFENNSNSLSCSETTDFIKELLSLQKKYDLSHPRVNAGLNSGQILLFAGAHTAHENKERRGMKFLTELFIYQKKRCPKLKIKAGISKGAVFVGFSGSQERGEFTCLGNSVNLAHRLMMKAGRDEIVSDEKIAKIEEFEFNFYGSFSLKGFENEIKIYRFSGFANEVFSHYSHNDLFVGREKELTTLAQWIEKPLMEGRNGGFVYIHGNAGIGKTRFVRELQRRAQSKTQNHNYYYLPSDDIIKKPFNSIIYFLKEYFDISDKMSRKVKNNNFKRVYNVLLKNLQKNPENRSEHKEVAKELRRTKSVLAALLGLERKHSFYDTLDGKNRYENTIKAVRNFLLSLSLLAPSIFVFEDAHWLDNDSRLIVESLTNNTDSYPFIILALCRYQDNGMEFDLIHSADLNVQSLKLSKLNKVVSQKMIKQRLSSLFAEVLKAVPDRSLYELVLEKSGGNPLYIEQIGLYLKENNYLAINEKGNIILIRNYEQMPEKISGIIVARIDRLSAELKDLIKTASVIGKEFSLKILAGIQKKSGGDINNLLLKLVEGEDEQIWQTISQLKYMFRHSLIRESVYQLQMKKRLRKLHAYAAQTIEELFGDNKEYYIDLALHHEQAGNELEAKTYYLKAAVLAQTEYRNEHAIELYGKVISYYETRLKGETLTANEFSAEQYHEYIKTLTSKAEILSLIGRWQEADLIYQNVLIFAEKNSLLKSYISAALSYTDLLYDQGKLEESKQLAEQILAKSKKITFETGIFKAEIALGKIYMNNGDLEKAIMFFKNTGDAIIDTCDYELASMYYRNLGIAYAMSFKSDEALACFDKVLHSAIKKGIKKDISSSYNNIGCVFTNAGKTGEALEYYEKSMIIDEKIGDATGVCASIANLAMQHRVMGNYQKALKLHKKQFAIAKKLHFLEGMADAHSGYTAVYLETGRYRLAIKHCEEELKFNEQLGRKMSIVGAFVNLGTIYRNIGDYVKAETFYKKAFVLSDKNDYKYYNAYAQLQLGGLAYYAGDFKQAITIIKKSRSIAKEVDAVLYATSLESLGLVYKFQKDYTECMHIYTEAIAVYEQCGMKSALAKIYCSMADLKFVKKDYQKALELNNKAYELAEITGRDDLIFNCKILKAKINYIKDKQIGIDELLEMLGTLKDKSEIASLNYELYLLSKNIKYGKKSVSLYKTIYRKTPNIEFKTRIAEIEAGMEQA